MKKPSASALQLDLARQIADQARAEGWAEGTRVPEQTLARALGVSRSPVRAALKLLAAQGLLRSEPGRGFILARPPEAAAPALIPPSADDDLYAALLADRANGRIALQVSETELIGRYQASRGQIRKAFIRLAAEGLAQRLRGHGWQFADSLDSEEALEDSYHYRMLIECGALRQPGYRADPARLAQLRRQHEEILAKGRSGITSTEWFAINKAFHEAVVAGSRNRYLIQAIRQQNSLRHMREFAVYPALGEARILQSCREHLDIIAAIEAGDLGWAEAQLQRHLSLALKAQYEEESK
jgi:DNA-binding GntR family transcriptional regulator